MYPTKSVAAGPGPPLASIDIPVDREICITLFPYDTKHRLRLHVPSQPELPYDTFPSLLPCRNPIVPISIFISVDHGAKQPSSLPRFETLLGLSGSESSTTDSQSQCGGTSSRTFCHSIRTPHGTSFDTGALSDSSSSSCSSSSCGRNRNRTTITTPPWRHPSIVFGVAGFHASSEHSIAFDGR